MSGKKRHFVKEPSTFTFGGESLVFIEVQRVKVEGKIT